MRIYIDESGTQGEDWLVIGMLFVTDHGMLHSQLIGVKEELKYYNASPKKTARYKETHLAEFRANRDVELAKKWIDFFLASNSYFRCVVVDWSIWEGKYFGNPFEPAALKKRRAYKKWTEMLLQPEVQGFHGARLFLDRLRICHGYDVIEHLKDRFTRDYEGSDPWIKEFTLAESWKDGNQCLQLADLLVGCVYRKLVPPISSAQKHDTVDYLYSSLAKFGVKDRRPSFWRGFHQTTLTKHFPKFSEWYWTPQK